MNYLSLCFCFRSVLCVDVVVIIYAEKGELAFFIAFLINATTLLVWVEEDNLVGGRTFCRKTFCRTDTLPTDNLSKDFLPNGHFDERTLRREDILPKGQLAENREIFWVRLVNVCLTTVNFRVVAKFIMIHKQVCKQGLKLTINKTLIKQFAISSRVANVFHDSRKEICFHRFLYVCLSACLRDVKTTFLTN